MAIELDVMPALDTGAGRADSALRLAIGCFLVWGFAYGLLDVLNKHFQETLHIGKAQSAWLQIAYFGAYLTMSLPAGSLLEARGYKSGMLTGLLVTAVGALCFIPAAESARFPRFVASMFVLASGLCFLEAPADTYVNVLGPADSAAQRLNLAQSFNAVGVFFGPIVGGALFFNPAVAQALGGEQRAVQVTYLIAAALVLLFAAVIWRASLPERLSAAHDSGRGGDLTAAALPLSSQRHFVLAVVTQALYAGAQVGSGAYFINLVTENWPGMTSQHGAFLLSVATVGYLLGRFLSTALLSRLSARALLMIYGSANVLLCALISANLPRYSSMALIAVFFFMSAMFATIFTPGVRNLGATADDSSALS